MIVTPGVRAVLTRREIRQLLHRHRSGDWGSGYVGRTSPNERFLGWEFRLDSHYQVHGRGVLITTDPVSADTGKRASTTVYLFEEYSKVHGLE